MARDLLPDLPNIDVNETDLQRSLQSAMPSQGRLIPDEYLEPKRKKSYFEKALEEVSKHRLIHPKERETKPFLEGRHGAQLYGFLEPTIRLGTGAANLVLPESLKEAMNLKGFKENQELLHNLYESQYPEEFGTGKFGGASALGYPFRGVGLASNGIMRYLAPPLTGAALGGAYGAINEPYNEETRGTEALQGALSGGALGTLPSAIAGVTDLGKALTKSFPVEKIAKNIIGTGKGLQEQSRAGYKELFNEAKNADVGHIKAPKVDYEAIKNYAGPKKFSRIERFIENPDFKNAHYAQSDLGKLERALLKADSQRGLVGAENHALSAVEQAKKRIRGNIFQELNQKNPKLAQDYIDLTENYRKEVLPFKQNPNIIKFKKGHLTESDLVDALMKDKAFKAQLGEKFPELASRKKLSSIFDIMKKATGTAGVVELMHLLGMV